MKNRGSVGKALSFSIYRMYWLCLAALVATAAAQGSYDLEPRVPYPGKSSSLGPLYSSGLSPGQGFRDNSYEDNIVTPTPSPTPAYRNPGSQQPVSNQAIICSPDIPFSYSTIFTFYFYLIVSSCLVQYILLNC